MKPAPVCAYKGHAIQLTPHGEYCSNFAADIRDASGKLLHHVKAAGKTEESAVARCMEIIDFEESLRK